LPPFTTTSELFRGSRPDGIPRPSAPYQNDNKLYRQRIGDAIIKAIGQKPRGTGQKRTRAVGRHEPAMRDFINAHPVPRIRPKRRRRKMLEEEVPPEGARQRAEDPCSSYSGKSAAGVQLAYDMQAGADPAGCWPPELREGGGSPEEVRKVTETGRSRRKRQVTPRTRTRLE